MEIRSLLQPGSLSELLRGIETADDKTMLLAGGTDVIPMLKQVGLSSPVSLIALGRMKELSGITLEDTHTLRIGATTRLMEIQASPLLQKHCPVLVATASHVATAAIRSRATLGGNLLVNHRCVYFNQAEDNRCANGSCFKAGGDTCHLVPTVKAGDSPLCRARFVSDLAAVLLVLGARLRIVGRGGERTLEARDFYLPDGMARNRLEKGEVLAWVEVPPTAGHSVHYEKLRIRGAIDFPSVGVAVRAEAGAGQLRIGVAHVGLNAAPVWLELSGAGWSDELIEKAAQKGVRTAKPLKQDLFSPSYRREMVGVFIRRALKRIREARSAP